MSVYTPFPTEALAVNLASTSQSLTGFTLGFARRLYIGVSGDVVVRYKSAPSVNVTYKSVPVGYIDGQFVSVNKTGTTATNIIAES